jgi:hypothetical protein
VIIENGLNMCIIQGRKNHVFEENIVLMYNSSNRFELVQPKPLISEP